MFWEYLTFIMISFLASMEIMTILVVWVDFAHLIIYILLAWSTILDGKTVWKVPYFNLLTWNHLILEKNNFVNIYQQESVEFWPWCWVLFFRCQFPYRVFRYKFLYFLNSHIRYEFIYCFVQCTKYWFENLLFSDITVCPLLFQKGENRLALYGMSSVKDERLHRLFRENCVKMLQPEEDTDKWFNLLVMHQNRTKRATVDKNHIPEHFIDSMFDLVRIFFI